MIKDLIKKSDDELKMMVIQLRVQLLENRFKAAQGDLKQTHLIKEIRKLIAKVLTVLHQRNLRIETKDYHRLSKILIEEQNKAAEVADTQPQKLSFLEQAKNKLGSLKPKIKNLTNESK